MSKKDEVIQRLKAEVEEWEAKLEPLKLKAKLGEMEARDKFEEVEKTVREKTHHLRGRLEELKNDTGEAWEDLAKGCETSWGEAKSAIKAALSRFRD